MTEALLALLEREEEALARADLTAVLSLQDEKAALVSRVREGAAPDEAVLAGIRAVAARNERRFALMLDACEQARTRVSAARERALRVGYEADGGALSGTDRRSTRRV